ncbi:head-tail joining protein [Pseudazoarcus pumilus]|uniref:Uncharacterized protein n=1 Tax=Pseudazoarcus pumilus TaxID=2067960 RepID=A0A2I6S843_9RHOO|nr:hypothetical protein [Pseudazoarcus pumilus]AUN95407.1 hypothetical protein C0099_10995 [Pseudazoarcus pumilus]
MSEGLVAPFADVDAMLSEQTHALLDNVVATPSAGDPFTGQFDVVDRSSFDGSAMVGDHTLRYLAADAAIEAGDVLSIDGVDYRVADTPERINAHERVAQLVGVFVEAG